MGVRNTGFDIGILLFGLGNSRFSILVTGILDAIY
jgi:hypothetical protein